MVVGLTSSIFWIFFVHESNAKMLKLVELLTGKTTILPYPWSAVDPILIAFPLAFIVTVIVTLFTKPVKKAIVDKCFK